MEPIIHLSITSATAIGTTIGAGIVAAAKILVGYLRIRDAEVVSELRKNRNATEGYTGALLAVQRDSLHTTGELTVAVNRLVDRIDGKRNPTPTPQPATG